VQQVLATRPAGSSDPAGRPRVVAAALLSLTLLAGAAVAIRAWPGSDAPPASAAASSATRATRAQGIAGIQERLRRAPGDARAWAGLGFAYVQQARITGDPTYYPKAEESLRKSLELTPSRNGAALVGMGALAAARHDFAAALRWGERARAINPYDATVYGVIGDALIELGRYPEAFGALQRMVDLRPDLSSYARASYAWELRGNIPAATHALEMALEAASTPGDAAYASYYLGELYWSQGNIARASEYYRQSVARDPAFVPGAQGLAKVAAAEGRPAEAIAGYIAVVERLPLPQYVIELADLYALAGDQAAAREQYALLAAQERLFRANGVNVDIETALFNADHGIDRAAGLVAARAEWSRRRSVFAADALSWSLYASGRYAEALRYSGAAMRLGMRNALFSFHRGMIERALGMRSAALRDLAEARRINANFSFRWKTELPAFLEGLR
jgi:tetratricopeptide (TPR) repeat protein